ncbi:MAG: hypothetical protein JNM84_05215 [Planctomycetes bacterium]|nr:hypothetical protein [Planctomycetota bacterium]
MRPALIVGIVSRPEIPASAQPALARKLRLLLRFLRYGASAEDPERRGQTLGARLVEELGDPSLSSQLARWSGLAEADLVLLTNPGPGADPLAIRVIEELQQADPLSRLSWRAAPHCERLSHILIAICETASEAAPSEAARLAESWLKSGAPTPTSARSGSRGPLFHLPLGAAHGEPSTMLGPLRLLLDALDWPRAAAAAEPLSAPTAQALRELRERSLAQHLEAAQEIDEFLELERYEAHLAPKEAQAHFHHLLECSAAEAQDLEAELRGAGGTQLVVDLREIAGLHARTERAAAALMPRLERRTMGLALLAVIGLLLFGHRDLSAAARFAAFVVGGLAGVSALALFYVQTKSARSDRSRALRGAAEAARVQFAWAACGVDRDSACSIAPRSLLAPIALELPRIAAAVAALPALKRIRLYRAQLRAWIGATERAAELRTEQQRRCAEGFAEPVRIALLAGVTMLVATGACLLSGRAELRPAAPLVVLSFALFGLALGPRAADLGWSVRRGMATLSAQLQAALPLAAILLWLAIACSEARAPHTRYANAFELALLFASLLLVPGLLAVAFLDRLLGRESERDRSAEQLALRHARLALEDLIARGERAALAGASAELASAESEIRAVVGAAGEAVLRARRS